MRNIFKAVRVTRAFLAMVHDANQLDRIFELVDALYASSDAAQRVVERMSRDPALTD